MLSIPVHNLKKILCSNFGDKHTDWRTCRQTPHPCY